MVPPHNRLGTACIGRTLTKGDEWVWVSTESPLLWQIDAPLAPPWVTVYYISSPSRALIMHPLNNTSALSISRGQECVWWLSHIDLCFVDIRCRNTVVHISTINWATLLFFNSNFTKHSNYCIFFFLFGLKWFSFLCICSFCLICLALSIVMVECDFCHPQPNRAMYLRHVMDKQKYVIPLGPNKYWQEC